MRRQRAQLQICLARVLIPAEGKQKDVKDVIKTGVFKNVDLIPSHVELFTIDLDLASATARELKLQRALKPIIDNYDIIVCDCPPNLTIPTQNALAVCTHFVVPISPDFLSALGVGLLLRQVKKFCEDMQVDPKLAGMVLSRIGRPAIHREQTVAALRQQFGAQVFTSELHERVAVSEAVQKNMPIHLYDSKDAAMEFRNMSEELLKRIGAQKP
jgi:chromosome partitioning protein